MSISIDCNAHKKTVIIGLGNPFLCDDRAGPCVVRELKQNLSETALSNVDVVELYAGGLRLLDALVGYDRAIIVDAMVTGTCEAGTIRKIPIEDCGNTKNTLCVHDMDLKTALEFGRMTELHLPSEISVWGIEAADVNTFSETLTPQVQESVNIVAEIIRKDLVPN